MEFVAHDELEDGRLPDNDIHDERFVVVVVRLDPDLRGLLVLNAHEVLVVLPRFILLEPSALGF